MGRFSRLIIFLASLALVISTNAIGQDSTKTSSIRTVFGGKKASLKVNYLGIYFAPEYQYGQLGGSFTSLGGGSFMLQFNKKLGVGVTGFGSFRNNQSSNINGSFAGLKLEYTLKPDAAIHVSFPLVIGVGGNGLGEFGEHHAFKGDRDGGVFPTDGIDPNVIHTDYDDESGNISKIIQPGIIAEANLARFVKFHIGANYRLAFNSNGYNTDYQGFSANTGLKIGLFDYSLKRKKSTAKTDKL
jgi:hypothetical protein